MGPGGQQGRAEDDSRARRAAQRRVVLLEQAATVLSAPTEDDYPSAALGSDGRLYVAYVAFTHGEGFRKRISEEDCDKLPAPPKVDLVLVLRNTGKDPVMIWPGGGIDEPELAVTGPGLVVPDSLESFSCSNSATTPQPVILPGEKFRIPIKSLNPGGFSLDNVYWSEPGEYTITATYPVWKNLPPHLPGLFKHPEPQGPPIRFLVKTPPVKVKVVTGK